MRLRPLPENWTGSALAGSCTDISRPREDRCEGLRRRRRRTHMQRPWADWRESFGALSAPLLVGLPLAFIVLFHPSRGHGFLTSACISRISKASFGERSRRRCRCICLSRTAQDDSRYAPARGFHVLLHKHAVQGTFQRELTKPSGEPVNAQVGNQECQYLSSRHQSVTPSVLLHLEQRPSVLSFRTRSYSSPERTPSSQNLVRGACYLLSGRERSRDSATSSAIAH